MKKIAEMVDQENLSVVEQNTNLFEFIVDSSFNLSINISLWLLIVAPLILVLILGCQLFKFLKIKTFELDEIKLGVGGQKFKFKPNAIDSQIAYKIWVELSTRKIGMPVELDKDVIVEVYNSWYKFFDVTRELIKEVPATKLKRKETRKIINLSIDVLNAGVRPHLTEWQAKFRKWFDNESAKKDKIDLSPQELQRSYQDYDKLTQDLIENNKKLIEFRKAMYKLAFGEKQPNTIK